MRLLIFEVKNAKRKNAYEMQLFWEKILFSLKIQFDSVPTNKITQNTGFLNKIEEP